MHVPLLSSFAVNVHLRPYTRVSCTSTVKTAANPAPNLECAAIWDLAGSGVAAVNATDPARRAVAMFVDNVDNDKCRDYISGTTWARPMGEYAPYAAWQLEALPAVGEAWGGGAINATQEDECAAQACQRCYCLSLVSLTNLNDLVQDAIRGEDAGYCEAVYKQVRLEAAVQGMTISVTAVTNLILMAAAKGFSRFERHPTISATEATTAKYTFFSLFVNQAVLPIVLYSLIAALDWLPILFKGSYTDMDMGWYNKVMVVMIGTAIINSVAFPLTRIAGAVGSHLTRKCRASCARSQLALNRLYTPEPFELSQRYGRGAWRLCIMGAHHAIHSFVDPRVSNQMTFDDMAGASLTRPGAARHVTHRAGNTRVFC